jgi:two-component system, LytTR family, sensor kinase
VEAPVTRRCWKWLVFCTLPALVSGVQTLLSIERPSPPPAGAASTLLAGLAQWYLWALAAPLIIHFTRRFPMDRANAGRHVFLHLGISLHLSLLEVLAVAGLQTALLAGTFADAFIAHFTGLFHWNLLVYWAVLAGTQAVEHEKSLGRERRTAQRLRRRLAQERIASLTSQLRPHFLFNALNDVAELVHEDADAADRALVQLGELLRSSVELGGDPGLEVPLEREIQLAARYLDIQRVRLGGRLTVEIDVPARARGAAVPALLLLPLVENAVRHGLAGRRDAGVVGIRAHCSGAWLVLEVRDDGPGVGAGGVDGGVAGGVDGQGLGIGLANTRDRLRHFYGRAQALELRDGDDGGAVARVRLPLRGRVAA